jgi:hypothetical protein
VTAEASEDEVLLALALVSVLVLLQMLMLMMVMVQVILVLVQVLVLVWVLLLLVVLLWTLMLMSLLPRPTLASKALTVAATVAVLQATRALVSLALETTIWTSTAAVQQQVTVMTMMYKLVSATRARVPGGGGGQSRTAAQCSFTRDYMNLWTFINNALQFRSQHLPSIRRSYDLLCHAISFTICQSIQLRTCPSQAKVTTSATQKMNEKANVQLHNYFYYYISFGYRVTSRLPTEGRYLGGFKLKAKLGAIGSRTLSANAHGKVVKVVGCPQGVWVLGTKHSLLTRIRLTVD